MPTILTHSFTGIASGAAVYDKSFPRGFWLLSVICSIVPDADVVCFKPGIPYSSFWGHSGFFHSLFFAFIVGSLTGIVFMKSGKRKWKERMFFAMYFSFVMSLHGILGAFTNGGLGIALLSPFTVKRYFFPITPIMVSPFNPKAFIRESGLRILKNEMFWVWLPSISLSVLLRMILIRLRRNFSIDKHR